MADKDININFRAEQKQKDKFYRKCKKDGVDPAAIMRRLIGDYATGDITYGPQQKEA